MTRRQPQEVLVRMLPSDAPADDRQALHRQFEALKALDDPRVPEAVAFYEGLGALALARVSGVPLVRVIDDRRSDLVAMSPATLLDIVLELAETLQRVHHRNRCHGNLSPDQVLLGSDGKLWMFGFGDPPGATANAAWEPPECVHDGDTTAATDQWSLGALAAGLVTGRAPWEFDDASRRGNVEPTLAIVERQWPALGRVLRRMTEARPENRYPSMHPVRQELLALARKAPGRSERRELGAALSQPHEGRRVTPVPDADMWENEDGSEEGETLLINGAMAAEMLAEFGVVLDGPPNEAPAGEAAPPSDSGADGDGFAPVTQELPPIAEPSEGDDDPELTVDDILSEPDTRRPQQRLPEEAFPVVRPDVSEEVPTASLGRLAADAVVAPPEAPEAPAPDGLVGFSPQFEPPVDEDDSSEGSDQSATVIMRASDFADFAEEFLSDADEPAETAVPVTDSGEPSQVDDAPDDDLPTEPRVETFLTDDDVPPQAAAPSSPTDPVRRLAPVLVGLFVVVLLVWFATRML